MARHSFIRRGLLAAAAAVPAGAAWGQDFPQRPLRLLVPYGAGNVTDHVARALAEAFSLRWPHRLVVVENIPGAGGALGVAAAARAAPDGHTLVLSAMGALAVIPHLRRSQAGYDPLVDLVPIGLVAVTRSVLAVHPALPVWSMNDLAAHARGAGPVFYYSAGSGTLPHLNMELLKAALGAPLEHVPYRTSAAGLADLLAGRVQLTMDAASVTLPAIFDRRLRALFWSGPRRNPLLPDVPTAAEAVPVLDLANPWLGLLAPRGVPAAVLARLEDALAAALATAGLADRLGDGVELLGGGSEAFGRQLRTDHARFGALLAGLDIRSE